MKTQEQYIEEWKKLGDLVNVGWRVCKHITNSYKDKYPNLSLEEAIYLMRKNAEDKVVEINKIHKFIALEFINRISINPTDIRTAEITNNYVDSKVSQLKGVNYKLGYYRSIIQCLNKIKPEQLKIWVEYKF